MLLCESRCFGWVGGVFGCAVLGCVSVAGLFLCADGSRVILRQVDDVVCTPFPVDVALASSRPFLGQVLRSLVHLTAD